MPTLSIPRCFSCRHYQGPEPSGGFKCAAFERIPQEILDNEVDHTKPFKGDRGVRYERAPQQIPQIRRAMMIPSLGGDR